MAEYEAVRAVYNPTDAAPRFQYGDVVGPDGRKINYGRLRKGQVVEGVHIHDAANQLNRAGQYLWLPVDEPIGSRFVMSASGKLQVVYPEGQAPEEGAAPKPAHDNVIPAHVRDAFTAIPNVGPASAQKMWDAGFDGLEALQGATKEELVEALGESLANIVERYYLQAEAYKSE